MILHFKYVITNSGAILFNNNTPHLLVAKALICYSAGFCKVYMNCQGIYDVQCYGISESMELDSQPEIDKEVIKDFLNPISKVQYNFMIIQELYKNAPKTY